MQNMQEEIAIIGMATQLPGGVSNYDEFWRMLVEMREGRTEIPLKRWNSETHYDQESSNKSHSLRPGLMNTKFGYFVDQPSKFDCDFFKIPPTEAKSIDPQQRLLLELVWQTFEDAAIPPKEFQGSKTSVYMGIMNVDYGVFQQSEVNINQYTSTGLSACMASNRISYVFDLRGPSVTVDTACSSSLVALHNSIQDLRSGRVNMALCGGANMMLIPKVFIALSHLGVLSPDGRSKAFDQSGDGYARGEGGGVLLLKRLSDAMRDGDRIHAVVLGSAINSDGRSSVPITAPNEMAQRELYQEVFSHLNFTPDKVQYVEAHGTGTSLGDATELNSIGSFFIDGRRNADEILRIGSVKSNVGHLESGAGAIGLIKTILSLKNKKFVPSLHFKSFPSQVRFPNSLKVPTVVEDWPLLENSIRRYAAVNSFGYGGTNSHAVLAEFVPQEKPFEDPNSAKTDKASFCHVLAISSTTSETLLKLCTDHLIQLKRIAHSTKQVNAYCYAANLRRHLGFPLKELFSGETPLHLIQNLESFVQRKSNGESDVSHRNFLDKSSENSVVLIFAGQGSQFKGILSDIANYLIASTPTTTPFGKDNAPSNSFHSWISSSSYGKLLMEIESWTLKERAWSLLHCAAAVEPILSSSPCHSAIAIFAAEVCLASLLTNEGSIQVQSVVGYSLGEFAASYVVGALSLNECLEIIWHVGEVAQKCQSTIGELAAFSYTSNNDVASFSSSFPDVEIVCYNSNTSLTVFVPINIVDSLKKDVQFKERISFFDTIKIPSHSSRFESLKEELLPRIQSALSKNLAKIVKESSPTFISTSTLDQSSKPVVLRTTNEKLQSLRNPLYWWYNVRSPVFFKQAINQLQAENLKKLLVLELSPSKSLSPFVEESLASDDVVIISPLHASSSTTIGSFPTFHSIFNTVKKVFVNNASIDVGAIFSESFPNSQVLNQLPKSEFSNRRSLWSESLDHFRSRMGFPEKGDLSVGPIMGFLNVINDVSLRREYPSSVMVLEGNFSSESIPLLPDHVYEGSMLLPACFFLELFRMVSRKICTTVPSYVRNAQFVRAAWINPKVAYVLRIVLTPLEECSFSCDIHYKAKDQIDGDFTFCSSATLQFAEFPHNEEILTAYKKMLPVLQSIIQKQEPLTLNRFWSHESWYKDFKEAGFGFGPRFRLAENVWATEGEAIVHLNEKTVQDNLIRSEVEAFGYSVHPGILDAITQCLAAGSAGDTVTSSIPVSCGSYTSGVLSKPSDLYGIITNIHVVVDQKSTYEVGDAILCNNQGEVVSILSQFRCKLMDTTQSVPFDKSLISLKWTPRKLSSSDLKPFKPDILFITDSDSFDDDILQQVYEYSKSKVVESHVYRTSAQSIQKFAEEKLKAHQNLHCVIVCPTDCKKSMASTYDQILYVTNWLLLVLKELNSIQDQLIKSNENNEISIDIITYRMFSLSASESGSFNNSLLHSSVLGAFRVAAMENDLIRYKLIDVFLDLNESIHNVEPDADLKEALVGEIFNQDPKNFYNHICLRLQNSQVVRFVGCYERISLTHSLDLSLVSTSKPVPFQNVDTFDSFARMANLDATFILFGASGSFGLFLADQIIKFRIAAFKDLNDKKLSAFPITSIVLVNRQARLHSGDDSQNLQNQLYVEKLRTYATFDIIGGDLTNKESISKVFENVRGLNRPPVRGIVNMAMVLADASITSTTSKHLEQVMKPKVLGSLILAEICEDLQLPIEFLMLFSSSTSLFGNGGQFSYGAANSFLDFFATSCSNKMKHVRCFSVNFPPIRDLGYLVHNHDIQKKLLSNGWNPMSRESCEKAIRFSLRSEYVSKSCSIGFLSIIPLTFFDRVPEYLRNSLWSNFEIQKRNDIQSHSLQTATKDPREIVFELLHRLNGYAVESLRPEQTLTQIGIDSINGRELRNRFLTRFKIDIPIEELLKPTCTLKALIDQVQSSMSKNQSVINEVKALPYECHFSFGGANSIDLLNNIKSWYQNQVQAHQDDLEKADFFQRLAINTRKHSVRNGKDHSHHANFTWSAHNLTKFINDTNQKEQLQQINSRISKTNDQISVVFLFPGQGSQFAGMSKPLYDEFEIFRSTVDICLHHLQQSKSLATEDLECVRHWLLESTSPSSSRATETSIIQLVLFIFEYSLSILYLNELGLQKPDCLVGHSVGELVASCLSGVFPLRVGLQLICMRGKIMSQTPSGLMMAISADRNKLDEWVLESKVHVELCAHNNSSQFVVGGTSNDINQFKSYLEKLNVSATILSNTHAFHTSYMKTAAIEFSSEISNKTIPLQIPSIPYISNVTGDWIRPDDATSPSYYGKQIASPVQMHSSLITLNKWIMQQRSVNRKVLLLEAGPGGMMLKFCKLSGIQFSTNEIDSPARLEYSVIHEPVLQTFSAVLSKLWILGFPQFSQLETKELIAVDSAIIQSRETSQSSTLLRETIELSSAQQRFWLMEQQRPGRSSNRMTKTIELFVPPSDVIDVLKTVATRHEMLRVAIEENNQSQYVRNCLLEIEKIDFNQVLHINNALLDRSWKDWTENLSSLRELIFETVRNLKISLDKAPLWRIEYFPIRSTEKNHALVCLIFHHIIADAVSCTYLSSEIAQLANGNELTSQAGSFFDSCALERKFLESEKAKHRIEFWKNFLSEPSFFKFSSDVANSQKASYEHKDEIARREVFEIKDQEYDQLAEHCSRLKVTVASFIGACLTTLLFQYSDRKNTIAIGVAEDRRFGETDSRPTFGCFTNVVVQRTHLNQFNKTFTEFIQDYHLRTLQVFENSLPLQNLLRILQIPRSADLNTLFQVFFNFRALGMHRSFSMFEDEIRAPQFDLEFDVDHFPSNKNIHVAIVYDSQFLSSQFVGLLTHSFRSILIEASSNFHSVTPVKFDFPRLKQLVALWNPQIQISKQTDEVSFLRNDNTVLTRWNEVVLSFGSNPAILVNSNQFLTFKEVDIASTKLATFIREKMKEQNVKRVGVYLDRVPELPLVLLAILKSDCSYVPFDPAFHGQNRIQSMVRTSSVRMILTRKSLESNLVKVLEDVEIPIQVFSMFNQNFDFDTHIEAFNFKSTPDKELLTTTDNRNDHENQGVYVEFTSGSTGNPKAIEISNRNLMCLIKDIGSYFRFNSKSRTVLFHSYAFDLHAWEIWGTWLSGGMLIPLQAPPSDIAMLHQLVSETKPTHLSLTPVGFRRFCDFGERFVSSPDFSIKVFMICGEKLDFNFHVGHWWSKGAALRHPDTLIVNCYGITETTVINSFHAINQHTLEVGIKRGISLIGLPLPHSIFLVLDENLQPVPPGIAGELFIAGDCVSVTGYLGQFELSKARFIPIPANLKSSIPAWQSHQSHDLLYKTGDNVVFDVHTNDYIFLGRLDNQVKIGGFRVETQEVEAILMKLFSSLIKDVAVVSIPTRNGNSILVAYYTYEADRLDTNLVGQKLSSFLPSYSIPSLLVALPEMPMTGSFKIARTTLANIDFLESAQERELRPATSVFVKEQTEKQSNLDMDFIDLEMKTIWNKVLRLVDGERTSVSDDANYFSIGGDSMQAVFLINTVNSRFGVNLSPGVIYSASTVKTLSALVRKSKRSETTALDPLILMSSPLQINNHSKQKKPIIPVVIVHPAGGSVLIYKRLVFQLQQQLPHVDFYGIEDTEKFQAKGFDSTKSQINHYCLYLWKHFGSIGKKFVLVGYSLGGVIAAEIAKFYKINYKTDVSGLLIIDSDPEDNPNDYSDCYLIKSFLITMFGENSSKMEMISTLETLKGDELFSQAVLIANSPSFVDKSTFSKHISSIKGDLNFWQDIWKSSQPFLKSVYPTLKTRFAFTSETVNLLSKWNRFCNVDSASTCILENSTHSSIIQDQRLSNWIVNCYTSILSSTASDQVRIVSETNLVNHEERTSSATEVEAEMIMTANNSLTEQKFFSETDAEKFSEFFEITKSVSALLSQTPHSTQNSLNLKFYSHLLYSSSAEQSLMNSRLYWLQLYEKVLKSESSVKIRALASEENFDTGNSNAQPIDQFVNSFQLEVSNRNTYRFYESSANVSKENQQIGLDFLYRLKLLTPLQDSIEPADRYSLIFGSGTIQLWDSVVRTLGKVGDVVIVPTCTYGLMLPQIELAGLESVQVRLREEDGWKLTSKILQDVIVQTNKTLVRKWKDSLVARISLWAISNSLTDKERNPLAEQSLVDAVNSPTVLSFEDVESLIKAFLSSNYKDFKQSLELFSSALKSLTPPRVIAVLHLNPTLYGTSYSMSELTEIAKTCNQFHVNVVEDMSYAMLSLSREAPVAQSLLHLVNRGFCLVGLSKSFSIPNVRIGVLVCRQRDMTPISHYIQSTVGHISSMIQSATISMFQTPVLLIRSYLNSNSDSFRLQTSLLIRLFRGRTSKNILGIDEHELEDLIRAELKLDSNSTRKEFQELFQSFLEVGLTKEFKIINTPDAGFFILADSTALGTRIRQKLNSISSQQIQLSNSLLSWAFLAFVCGIRVIPEELMGVGPQDPCNVLRFSCTIPRTTMIWFCFVIYYASISLLN